MARTFQLEFVTPTRVIDCGQVSYLRAPSTDGLFGVMAGHTRAMISLAVGPVNVTNAEGTRHFATNGGYADILGTDVQLLVETAEEAMEIDESRAAGAAERARERLAQRGKDRNIDAARANIALVRAINRLRVAGRKH